MSSNASTEPSAREHPPVTAQAAYHPQPGPEGPGVNRTSGSAGHPLAHGYNHTQPSQNESHIHPELRSGLEAVAAASGYPPVPPMIPPGLPPPDQAVAMSGPPASGPHAVAAADPGDGGADGRKAKRELSQSKRAAQNRAAQRAFRQRKEGYIKKLEEQVKGFGQVEAGLKALQEENFALKDYVITLQSRLVEAYGEYPPPPPGISFSHPQQPPRGTVAGGAEPPQNPAGPGANPLEVAAQAIAGLNRSEQLTGRGDPYAVARTADEDARTAEELTRQMQADGGGPDGLPAAPM